MQPARPGPTRQTEIFLAGVRGIRPRIPTDGHQLEAAAERVMSRHGFAYVAGAAGNESTKRANISRFDRWRVMPRMLRDVSERDLTVELFGRRWPAPFLLCPIGVLELTHPEADLAVARAASSRGLPMIFSNQASVPMEICAQAMGDSPHWFQLYWGSDEEFVDSLLQRAERCGCEAIVLTLDTTMLGWRTRDLDLGYVPFLRGRGIAQYTSDPVFMRKIHHALPGDGGPRTRPNLAALRVLFELSRVIPGGLLHNLRSGDALAAVRRFAATVARPSINWKDLPSLRARTRLPILLKGVMHPDDARRAIDAGANGIIVSNHGGRQIDGGIAAIDALPGVVQAVGGAVPVLMDSGIRSGADVFRALALGANAVGVGRPFVYALGLAGQAGVGELIDNFVGEFELTMALAGCRSVAEIGPDAVTAVD